MTLSRRIANRFAVNLVFVLPVTIAAFMAACGGDDDDNAKPGTGGTGGSSASGGKGGSAGKAGSTATGGTAGKSTGGTTSAGGTTSTGGTGGTTSTGGTGGTTSAGGTTSTGGTGGSTATGGTGNTGNEGGIGGESAGMGGESGEGEGGAAPSTGGSAGAGAGAGGTAGAAAGSSGAGGAAAGTAGTAGTAGMAGGAGTSSGSANIFTDGSFESGTDGWFTFAAPSPVVSTTVAHTGAQSLEASTLSPGDAAAVDITSLVTPIMYAADVWVQVQNVPDPGTENVHFQYALTCTGGTVSYPSIVYNTLVTNGAWMEITGTMDLSSCATDGIGSVTLFLGADAGDLYIDDVSLIPNTPVR